MSLFFTRHKRVSKNKEREFQLIHLKSSVIVIIRFMVLHNENVFTYNSIESIVNYPLNE